MTSFLYCFYADIKILLLCCIDNITAILVSMHILYDSSNLPLLVQIFALSVICRHKMLLLCCINNNTAILMSMHTV